jgi:N-acetylmuramic acid 6-phosphate (MurNAc-6-P) etherase
VVALNAAQWLAVGSVAAAAASFLCALWATGTEHAAPGWRTRLLYAGAGASGVLVVAALAAAH